MYIATVGMRTCGVHCFRAMPSHLLQYTNDMQFSYGPLHVGVGGQGHPKRNGGRSPTFPNPLLWVYHKEGLHNGINEIITHCQMYSKWHTISQTRRFYSKIWHSWLPKKLSSFLWQCLENGLPIGEWHTNVKLLERCSLCTHCGIETQAHTFHDYSHGNCAWTMFFNLPKKHDFPIVCHDW